MADEKVTKGMTLGEILAKHPNAARIMVGYGLHCVGCHVAAWETLEQGAKAHGLDDNKVEEMVNEINKLIEKKNKE